MRHPSRPVGLVFPALLAAAQIAVGYDPAGAQPAPVHLESRARPVGEVLARLPPMEERSRQAGRELAARKVCVLFRGVSSGAAAGALAAALDAKWETPAEPAPAPLVLKPTDRYRLQLGRARAAQRALRAARTAALVGSVRQRLDPDAPERHPDAVKNPPAWMRPRALYPLLRAIPGSAWQSCLGTSLLPRPRAETPALDKTPYLVVSGAWLEGAPRATLAQFLALLAEGTRVPAEPPPGERGAAFQAAMRWRADSFRALARNPDGARLEIWMDTHQAARSREITWCSLEYTILSADPPVVQDGTLGSAPLAGGMPRLEVPKELLPAGARQTHSLESRRLPAGPSFPQRLDVALLQLGKTLGFSLAADFQTRGAALPVPGEGMTLGAWLEKLEQAQPLVHFWLGDMLVVRARDWAWRHDWEPDAAMVDLLQARRRAGEALSLVDLARAARQGDEPLRSLRSHMDEQGIALLQGEADRLFTHRHVLRAWGSLTERQRAAARSREGLALRGLTREQWREWEGLLRPFALLPPTARPRLTARLTGGDDPVIPGIELSLPGLGVVPGSVDRKAYSERSRAASRRPPAR